MFEESLVESTALLQSRNRWPALLSLAAQAVIAIVIIALPMLHPELLPTHAPAFTLTPPPPRRPPQTPPPPQHVHTELVSATAPTAPSAPPAQRSLLATLRPSTVSSTIETPITTDFGPSMIGNSTGIPGIATSMGHTPNVTVVSTTPPAPAGIIHVSGGVTAGLLLAPIRPEYPAIARAAHLEGTVIVRATISRTGHIERAQIVSGSAMLQNAALEAVERARYHPYLLNGEPTEVDTTVVINFRLGS